MTIPLVLCLLAMVIPTFFSRVTAAPFWLSVQALALGWITLSAHESLSWHVAFAGIEILLLRALLVPHLLRRALVSQAGAPVSLMPSNLFTWGIAISLIILAFKFGDGSHSHVRSLTLGVIAASAMMAFLILASNHQRSAQLVALLFMENALALFETLLPEPWPLPIHLAISGVYLLTVSLGSWLIADAANSVPNDVVGQGDTP